MAKKSPKVDDFDRRNSLSRQVRRTSKQKKGKGSGGGFDDRFNPPSIDEDPARIMLFAPDKPYKMKLEREKGKPKIIERDYGIVMDHFDGVVMRGFRCTAGLKMEEVEDGDWIITEGSKPCVGCYEKESGSNSLRIKKNHLFNIIKLGWFHEVEKEKEGKKKTIKYKEYRPCRGKKCKYCKRGVKRVFGHRMYWPLGPLHLGQLVATETSRISKKCRCGGKIIPRAFLCEKCEEAVRDLEEDPAEKGELRDLRDDKHECPHCGHHGYLKPYVVCKKCKNPKPLTLWDVEMEVHKSGEKMQSVIQVGDFKPLSLKIKAKVKDKLIPYDWDKLWQYRELEPEEQAQLIQVDNPFGESKSKKTAKGAANWDDEDYEDDEDDEDLDEDLDDDDDEDDDE